MYRKKIFAFSILEITIAMVISGILTASIFGMYSWLVKRYSYIQKQEENIQQMAIFISELERLTVNCQSIERGRTNQLVFNFPEKEEIVIQFEEDHILRQQLYVLDTLWVPQAKILEVHYAEFNEEWIESIVLELPKTNYWVNKVYDAKVRIEAVDN